MAILTDVQLQNGYFQRIGGFPPAKIIHTVAEYDGSEKCCIACTQLQGRYSDSECRRIEKDWLHFLKHEPTVFTALHFNSHVPQRLFDAICCQKNLMELRTKWGNYGDLSGLANLDKLQYLYLGSCPKVQDLTPITQKQELIVLFLQNFNRVSDYSPLANLKKLEQLIISGPTLADTPIAGLDFLLQMPNLRSLWLPNTRINTLHTPEEREQLRATGIVGVYGQKWWTF